MDFQKKYLEIKQKYLDLRQTGGVIKRVKDQMNLKKHLQINQALKIKLKYKLQAVCQKIN